MHCFIYGKECQNQETHQRYELLSTHSTILKICDYRGETETLAVKRRIMSCLDIVPAECRYHKKSQHTFDLDSKSAKIISSLDKKGRPQRIEQFENFKELCESLGNEGELYSLWELFNKMKELAKPSTNVYATKKYLKEKRGNQMLSALEIWQTL